MARSTHKQKYVISHLQPTSAIAESYRVLRTNIQFSNIDRQLQVIMITSVGPSEGKSTTVSNLAIVYAQSGKRVAIIDCDMRRPMMHHTFMLTNRWGLSSVLSHQCEIQDVIQKSGIPNLSIVTSGPIPPNPSEMLGSERMTAVLEQLKQDYDFILLDTPPVLAVTDAQIAATQSDGTILVVHSGKAKRSAALKAVANLQHVNAKLLGVVLNNVSRKKEDQYYYYYSRENES